MDQLDSIVIALLNQVTGQIEILDRLMVHLKGNNLAKGGAVLAVYWWIWFADVEKRVAFRRTAVATFFGSILAVLMARVLAIVLPFRMRPLHDPSSGLQPPIGLDPGELSGWSSFPSDHGALFVGLAFGICIISRRLGALVMTYVAAIVLLPRIYTGMHYVTDILAGGAVGIACVWFVNSQATKRRVSEPMLHWMDRHASSFYTALFLITFQIGTQFDGARNAASYLARAFKVVLL